ncbi:formylmethanofuran dehydrogenase subunit A [Micromonospora profundi]|nr:formylmethanofuran dehydrogenase subunit A [Micromonospora profundi]
MAKNVVEAIDLAVDVEVFSAPNSTKQAPLTIQSPEAGGWTTTTTCWSCTATCGSVCDASTCSC